MSEKAFKNLINGDVVKKISSTFKEAYAEFDDRSFILLSPKLKPLELKQRVLLITSELHRVLPKNYSKAFLILRKVLRLKKLRGFELWPISEYISQFGLEHFDESMELMCEMTKVFTSEFAIRPFLLQDPERVLSYLEERIEDENVHIRRWVSEGTRPILPWGGKIPSFILRPVTIPILEKLKDDAELYVRKSVANHLNDISRSHPELVVNTLTRWKAEAPTEHSKKIDWITRQALRTLIKKGYPSALELMGASRNTKVKVSPLKLNQKKFKVGDTLKFEFELESTSKNPQTLIIDYLIGFLKANGSTSSKVFKLKTINLERGERVRISKAHSLKQITTMVFYPGVHEVSIQINGKLYLKEDWKLVPHLSLYRKN